VEVGAFGEHLRREREMRGISLDEIVATTKIGRRLLTALEEEQFDLLPGGIFNKSYVRAYAKCVGMNEDEAVAEYLAAAQEVPPDTKVIAHQHAFHGEQRAERASFPVLPVVVLLVVVAGALGGWKLYQEHQRSREQREQMTATSTAETTVERPAVTAPQSTSNMTQAPPTQSPAPTSSTVQPPVQKPAAPSNVNASQPAQPTVNTVAGGPFEITIRPTGPAWISVKSDGIYVVRGIIKPPDVKTIHASGQVVFFTGNAGAVDVAFNGKNIPLTGGSNTEQTLVFTTKGLLPQAGTQ
jgi:cytoskeleton protein RodZ